MFQLDFAPHGKIFCTINGDAAEAQALYAAYQQQLSQQPVEDYQPGLGPDCAPEPSPELHGDGAFTISDL